MQVVYRHVKRRVLPLLVFCGLSTGALLSASETSEMKKGHNISKTGLVPIYPDDFRCSPLTSFYASWLDVDGTHREEIHSGVDGGELGEWIIAPASGTVHAAWEANWGWGKEGALLLVHTAAEVNMAGMGPPLYFTVYDHLKYEEIADLKVGQRISRGQRLARVYRPGGNPRYLPEVHWEVWEVQSGELRWKVNRHGGREWRSPEATLIDPLYMLGIHSPPEDGRSVNIVPFEPNRNYDGFRGFTYIFECPRK